MIIKRDVNDLWEYSLSGNKYLLAAFRNCKKGYKHYFDITNTFFEETGFQSCRCIFSPSIFVADLEKWKTENTLDQINYWLNLNAQEPLFVGASLAPLLAVFYGQYQNLVETPYLNWDHTHDLGKKPNEPFNLTLIEDVCLLFL